MRVSDLVLAVCGQVGDDGRWRVWSLRKSVGTKAGLQFGRILYLVNI